MFGEFVLFVLTLVALLSLIAVLINGGRRIGCDPVEDLVRIFAAILSAGLTAVALKVGNLQFTILGGILLIGLVIEHIKERC
jgi:hypothetical protein